MIALRNMREHSLAQDIQSSKTVLQETLQWFIRYGNLRQKG